MPRYASAAVTNSALGTIRRRWWVIPLLATLGAVLAALPESERVQEQVVRTYSATHTMLVNNPETTDTVTSTAVSPEQVTLLATVGEVPERVKAEIGFDGNAAELATKVEVAYDYTTGALTFAAEDTSAEGAEQIADTFAEQTNSYLAERQDVVYQQRLASVLERLDTLEGELNQLTTDLANDPEDPTLLAQRDAVSRQYSVAFEQSQALSATPPSLAFTTLSRAQAVDITTESGISTPTSRPVRAALGFAAGFAVGVGVVLVLGQFDRRIRTRAQAEDLFGTRARVTFPKVSNADRDGIVVRLGRNDPLADSYRTLRNVVSFVQSDVGADPRAPIVLVVSPGPGDGKTSTAANLAAAFAETGARTTIVNTDFRRPRLAPAVGVNVAVPLPFDVEELHRVNVRELVVDTDTPSLGLVDLSTVDATAGELARATAQLLPEFALTVDQVVVDSSPIGATAEVLDVVPLADVIVVVARVGHTSIDAATRAIATLRDLTSVPLVLALHGLKQERTAYYEYTDRRRGKRSRNAPTRKSATRVAQPVE